MLRRYEFELRDGSPFVESGSRYRYALAGSAAEDADPKLPFLDAMITTAIRDSLWRCDHGMHIDSDHLRKIVVSDVVDGKHESPDGQGVEGWYYLTPNLPASECIDTEYRERVTHQ